jgi:hypothetical protein
VYNGGGGGTDLLVFDSPPKNVPLKPSATQHMQPINSQTMQRKDFPADDLIEISPEKNNIQTVQANSVSQTQKNY